MKKSLLESTSIPRAIIVFSLTSSAPWISSFHCANGSTSLQDTQYKYYKQSKNVAAVVCLNSFCKPFRIFDIINCYLKDYLIVNDTFL